MMNSSSSPSSSHPSDPYVHPSSMIMSFANGQNHHQHLQQQLLDCSWDATAHNPPYFEPQPSPLLLPMNMNSMTISGLPFYPSLADHHHQYHPAGRVIKREEIGLNLGHRTYFSSADALTIDRLLTARAHQHHHQPPRCQAEGCKADLSGAKHYHRRHKVCEFHSKSTVVVAAGMQQRFCQQCSRFHVLGEFDESKRSCRKRLADHNRRRRKPQNLTTSTNSTAVHQNDHTHATRPSSTSMSRSTTTTTITTAISADNSGFQGTGQANNENNKAVVVALSSNEPAALLSLGGVNDRQSQLYQHYQHHLSSSTSTSNNNNNSSNSGSFFYHQSLFGSSSNEASQSTEGAPQALFEVDFM